MEEQIREIIAHHVGGAYEAKQKCAEEILRLFSVVGRSEPLVVCKKCGSSEMYQYTKTKDKCEDCGNIQDY